MRMGNSIKESDEKLENFLNRIEEEKFRWFLSFSKLPRISKEEEEKF